MKIDGEPVDREQAIALVQSGSDVAVAKLLALSDEVRRLREIEKQHANPALACSQLPSTPSGAVPPHLKPNRDSGKKRKRKPGRKKGHPGQTRPSPDSIDREQIHSAPGQCPDCSGPLDRRRKRVRRRLVEGLKRLAHEVVAHMIVGLWCGRCRKFVESSVTDAMPNDRISLYVFALTAYLHYRCGLSVRHCTGLLAHFGLTLSPGALSQGWFRLAEHLTPAYDQILEQVQASLVKMADETGWRIRGVTHWLWYFGSHYWSYYVIDRYRGTSVVNEVLGEVIEGILICDFWGAYNHIDAWAKQRCIFHLFTDIKKVDLRKPDDLHWKAFRKRLMRLFNDAIRLLARADLDPNAFEHRVARIHARLDVLIAESQVDHDANRLCKRLRRHRDEVLTFLDYPGLVSPYNNHSEQQMRPPVHARRTSQGNRSLRGAHAQAVLMSLIRSAELQERDPVHYMIDLMHAVLEGRPLQLPRVPDEDQLASAA